jgi:hypothetical protein
MRIKASLLPILILAHGCSPGAYLLEVGRDHPANPAAPEGTLPEPSATLAIGAEPSPAGVGGAQQAHGSRMPGQHGAHQAAVAGPGGEPAEERDRKPLYQCPMHSDVTSNDPERRCPRCNMKINKPAGDSDSPSGHQGHGGKSG